MLTTKLTNLMVFSFVALFGCHGAREFPELKKLDQFKQTEFIPTLEHRFSKGNNAVYCATLLFAWDNVRRNIGSPLQVSSQKQDLALLNNSSSFIDVLNTGEYVAVGSVDKISGSISVKAEFSKSLPFEYKLLSFDDRLIFDKKKVASFGMFGYHDEMTRVIKIGYYKNDNNFIIKLLSKDKTHEILLLKSDKQFNSLAGFYKEIVRLLSVGNKESKTEKLAWKYYFSEDDEVVIPKIKFNIETNFESLEGEHFRSNQQEYIIEIAWQQTAFLLDEYGAEVESRSLFETSVTEIDENEPKPKRMIFDKPFFLALRRTDALNPYFGLWVANAELMTISF